MTGNNNVVWSSLMSKVVATTVLPEDSGEVLTFGDTGDAIAISGDSLNLNNTSGCWW